MPNTVITTALAMFILAAVLNPSLAADESANKNAFVTGIGGLFFKAKEPKKLAEWYEQHLGVTQTPTSYEQSPWVQQAGPTVFAPFPEDSDYFGSDKQRWMINFRVGDLAALIARLQEAGIEVELDPNDYPNGRFARLSDPEGNPIQLWQPK